MTAPLLSPTDITPKFDFDGWLQAPSPATATNICPNAAYSDFAAAVNNRKFSFPLALPPSGNSLSLPTTTIPYTGASFSHFDALAHTNGNGQFYSANSTAGLATQVEYGYQLDGYLSGFTKDDIMEQATIHNSCRDMVSGYSSDGLGMLNSTHFPENTTTNWASVDDVDQMLDFSFSSEPGDQLPQDTEAILCAPTEDSRESVIFTPTTAGNQSNYVSASQWMAISNHDLKTAHDYEQVWDTKVSVSSSSVMSPAVTDSSSPLQNGRQGIIKYACRGALMKNKHTTFINHSIESTGKVTRVDGPSPNKRQRRSLDHNEKEDAAILRKIGVCKKCRKGRRKCKRHQARFLDLFSTNPYTLNLPCAHIKFEEARLFRLAPNKGHPMRCSDIVYQSIELSRRQYDCKTLRLTQDYGSELVIEVAQFDPQPGDKTAHMWHGKPVELPPYCIVGIQQAGQKMTQYIQTSRSNILLELLSSANDITREVLLQADRYQRRSNNPLVKQALDLFTATRIIERDWHIHGPETLGIPAMLDPLQNNQLRIPVTPVMDGQLDQLVTKTYLLPLRETFLANLQKTIYAGKKEDWFSVFLAMFIYLTHIECLLQHSRRNAKRYGLQRRYNDINLAEKYFEASRIALAHFHCIANGAIPLQLDWDKKDVAAGARLDSEQVAFIRNVLAKMGDRKRDGSVGRMKCRHRYEEPLYFCHQLFEEGWVAGVGRIVIHEEVVV